MRAEAKLRKLIVALAGACGLLASGAALAGSKSPPAAGNVDAAFRASYPLTARQARGVAAGPIAGIDLAKLVLPGLQLSARSDRAAADGGIVLSFAERSGAVRVLIHLGVFAEADAARQDIDAELHGVATVLAPALDPTLGETAWADDGGKGTAIVVAAQSNLAYSVSVLDTVPGLSAAAIASLVRAAMVSGAPAFPAATVRLPAAIDARTGGSVALAIPGGATYTLRADGGYIAQSAAGPVVHPFAPGAVTVHATVVDALGRVTVATAATRAQ